MSCNDNGELGTTPASIRWNVVRGDTSSIKVNFFESDGKTYTDTSGWEYLATAYNQKTDTSDELETIPGDGYVTVIANPDVTNTWGDGYKSIVSEIIFDIEVTKSDGSVWTPIIGTIKVLGDVTRSL